MVDSPNLRALARQLADLKRRQDRQEEASNIEQLKYSSLDDGSVVEKDATGSIVSRWGKQHDGTHGTAILNGPTPPVPTPPTLDGTAGTLTVTWDGTFPDDRRVPLDFQTIQIGVGAPDGDLTMVGVITSEAGGSKTLSVDPGDYDVALRSRAASGRMSAWSSPTRATVEPVVDPEVIARLEGAFTTSTEAPTPADGEGKPEGAYWTQIDGDGAQIARWRWVDGAWVDAPIAVEFIPEAYIDFLAANEAFIGELESEIIRADTFQGREFIGGTFQGTRFEGAEIVGGDLQIPGALAANPADGVVVGGAVPIYQHPGVQTFPGGTRGHRLTDNFDTPDDDFIVRVKVERSSDYLYGGGLSVNTGSFAIATLIANLNGIPLIGEGKVQEFRASLPSGVPTGHSWLRFSRNPEDPDLGPPTGEIEFSELEILTPSTGSITVSGRVSGAEGNFSSLTVGGAPVPSTVLLDETVLEGDVGTGTALTIPEELQGQFSEYRIQVQAGVVQAPADGVIPLVVLVNGDSSSAYRVQADAVHHNLGTVMFQNLAATAWPRTGFVAGNRGNLIIEFSVSRFGDVSYMPWQTTGWASGYDASGGGFKVFGGGRWSGPPQPLTHFLVRTTQGSNTWRTSGQEGNSVARLWGTR